MTRFIQQPQVLVLLTSVRHLISVKNGVKQRFELYERVERKRFLLNYLLNTHLTDLRVP